MFFPSALEIHGQILVGIAIAIGAFDPDLLATQLLAQRLQRANLIGDPVDPRRAFKILGVITRRADRT